MTRTPLPAACLIVIASSLFSVEASSSLAAFPHSHNTLTSCVLCHRPAEHNRSPGAPSGAQEDVHQAAGLSCHDCHGGNPDPSLARDKVRAHDRGFPGAGYLGTPKRLDVPRFCGRCHSDPAYMARFALNAKVDQEREYWASEHGHDLRKGDAAAAECVDCHGAHDMKRASDPRSPLHPTRLAGTCGTCHSEASRMQGRLSSNGLPLPTDQYERWRVSVHGRALLERGDVFSPTCNDCHGNHGSAPPGVDSIILVCGHCHTREAALFQGSPKHKGFDRHNRSFVRDMGDEGCQSCHSAPEPQASLPPTASLKQCLTCHGTHGVMRATLEMLAPLPPTPCELCHGRNEAERIRSEGRAPTQGAGLETTAYSIAHASLLARGRSEGVSEDALYDWMVDQALILPHHLESKPRGGSEGRVLRSGFSRLFTELRIGKTRVATGLSGKGGESAPVVRCVNCHSPEPELSKRPVGLSTARTFMESMSDLARLTTRAQVSLLAAGRGGVEVSGAMLDVERSLQLQRELQVLVHTFSVDKNSPFIRKREEARQFVALALREADLAAQDLHARRRGLLLWLILAAAALAGVALKRRQLARHEIGSGARVEDIPSIPDEDPRED